MEDNYSVKVQDFTESHFIKSFEKKYKTNWSLTFMAIKEELKRIDNLIKNTDKAETIVDAGNIKIVKTKFRVIGTKESAKASGNRCIVALNIDKKEVSLLLVYAKTDLSGKNETAQWQKIVKDNYYEYKGLF